MLGVVRQIVVEESRHPRRNVDGLIERGRIAPRFESAEDQKSDDGENHQRQPELSSGRTVPPDG
jgi:hypothetical protein